MPGALLLSARADAKKYITEGGFESDITITTPSGDITLETTGWAPKHHISFDTDGTPINAKNVHICLDEDKLIEGGIPVRINEEVFLKDYRITVKDSSGIDKKYVVKENFPDETLGLIVCILGDFE